MAQARNRASFAHQPRAELWIGRKPWTQYLDGDVAVEFRIVRTIHLADTASTYERPNFIPSKPRTSAQAHDVFRGVECTGKIRATREKSLRGRSECEQFFDRLTQFPVVTAFDGKQP